MKTFFDQRETQAIIKLCQVMNVDITKYGCLTTGGELVILVKPSAIVNFCFNTVKYIAGKPKFLVESVINQYTDSIDKNFPPSAFQRIKK